MEPGAPPRSVQPAGRQEGRSCSRQLGAEAWLPAAPRRSKGRRALPAFGRARCLPRVAAPSHRAPSANEVAPAKPDPEAVVTAEPAAALATAAAPVRKRSAPVD